MILEINWKDIYLGIVMIKISTYLRKLLQAHLLSYLYYYHYVPFYVENLTNDLNRDCLKEKHLMRKHATTRYNGGFNG